MFDILNKTLRITHTKTAFLLFVIAVLLVDSAQNLVNFVDQIFDVHVIWPRL